VQMIWQNIQKTQGDQVKKITQIKDAVNYQAAKLACKIFRHTINGH
jgi:hypothetical protein